MLRKKYEFRPDRTESGLLSKLYLTKKQRLSLLKWLLLGLVLVFLSVVQDVIMSRVSIFGATTDLVSCGILLTCMMLYPDSGSVFALAGSAFYQFSGSAPGPQVIFLLTGLGTLFNAFRHSYLRRSFGSTFLCAGTALILYELILFALGVFLGNTTPGRFGIFCISGALSVAVMPLLYPIIQAVVKIGGDSWKE